MKRYFTTLALLLLLLTLLIPGSLPTATAATSSEAEEEYHPGVGAKQLKIYKQEVFTIDCGGLPASICTPNGPNDPGEQEGLSVDMIIPGGATVETDEIDGGYPPKHNVSVYCFEHKESWFGHPYKMVGFFVQYPPEYNTGRLERVAGHAQGITYRNKVTGLWELDGSHACSDTVRGTVLHQNKASTRYTLTAAPDSDFDSIADEYDTCPSDPGPSWNDGCPGKRNDNSLEIIEDVYVRVLDPLPVGPRIRILQTQFRLLLSEEDERQPQMRINKDAMAVQPISGWTEDSRHVGCSDYTTNGIRRSECRVSVTLRNERELSLELSGGSSDGVSLGMRFSQGNSYATFTWTFRTQLSERNGVPGYSIYQEGKGSTPIFVPGN